VVHDPYVGTGGVREAEYLSGTRALPCQVFRNQDRLAELRVQSSLAETLDGADAVVIAVKHEPYLNLEPDAVVKMTGRPCAVIDCFGILDDARIRRYFELGCEVKGSAAAMSSASRTRSQPAGGVRGS